ncbi:hypothetical protein KVR01_005972 [Diaporthe batatas]|uniref:uncharacterized protein n=1 Tax=Diaporthe batatas TaxID=748121 RepID=UPI001D0558B4|nr:uncharacterized protein KVR01_005972 [Diaporthe batatas]KAG8164054.1 hypothetical protein KVR01_005972 [Diaporthe batatas]
MSSKAKLAFGVEFELLLKPSSTTLLASLEKSCPGWAEKLEGAKAAEKAAEVKGDAATVRKAKEEVGRLRNLFRVEIANTLSLIYDVSASTRASNFQVWSVIDEPTLDEVPGYCRVEFVSKVFRSDEDWQFELVQVFRFLKDWCYVQRTQGCSMHVHVSPSAEQRGQEDKWTTPQLNSIIKALSYFDNPITSIMPPERKNNPFAASNMLSDEVAKGNPKLKALYEQVPQQKWQPLFEYYDTELKSAIHRTRAHPIMGYCRYASWNFEHITNACGTIEFRRSPAVATAGSATHWASFTLGFIYAAACQTESSYWHEKSGTNTHPSVGDLDSFVKKGLHGLEAISRGGLRSLKADTSEPRLWSAAEMADFLKKKEKLGSCADPDSFVQKVCS